MSHLDPIADLIRSCLPTEARPPEGADDLFRLYAVLLQAKGEQVTDEDVHNAWTAWTQTTDDTHRALVPFHDLDARTRALDAPYTLAIRTAARRLHRPATA
ncbi:hypothetical protein DR950_00980 [Kitasatospora xanthocidica]|uniref:DUF7701 domain-containing protein n=1 Tax=Kitasatospora xanthocidica TaxID=83382 RepID=A0A372ZMS7_9ACTN|nr:MULTISPECIES: hypothetical protein [Streptomycetaceae]OKI00498.1 glutamine amidotransferase [Streptomyces sp. CB02056]RGD56555.1 hypothetical protein DR950_00980 [Kitasatospora xanthocidica]